MHNCDRVDRLRVLNKKILLLCDVTDLHVPKRYECYTVNMFFRDMVAYLYATVLVQPGI